MPGTHGSQIHLCAQESIPAFFLASTAVTTQDKSDAIWEHASPKLHVEFIQH